MFSKIGFHGLFLLLLVSSPPAADARTGKLRGGGERPPDIGAYADDGLGKDLSLYGLFNLDYHGLGYGGGVQFAYPVLPSGLIESAYLLDALHLEGGLETFHWSWTTAGSESSVTVLIPDAGVRYAVYLTDRLALTASLKIGLGIPTAEAQGSDVSFFWAGSLGVFFDLQESIALRAEAGWGRYRDVFRLGILFRI